MERKTIREPVVAGRFYQSDYSALVKQIDECYKHRLGSENTLIEKHGDLVALISPHAGYMYSGPVASHAFARMKNDEEPDSVLLLGPKHTSFGLSFAVCPSSQWRTPLGELALDNRLANILVEKVELLRFDEQAHFYEHSIEVQLPFIQQACKKVPDILPIALGFCEFAKIEKIGNGIAETLIQQKNSRKIIILVSSDFSHDTPRKDAYKLDAEAIDFILAGDPRKFYDLIVGDNRSVCGVIPITTLLVILRSMQVQARLLKYATSMDIIDHDRGVGYAAICFEAMK